MYISKNINIYIYIYIYISTDVGARFDRQSAAIFQGRTCDQALEWEKATPPEMQDDSFHDPLADYERIARQALLTGEVGHAIDALNVACRSNPNDAALFELLSETLFRHAAEQIKSRDSAGSAVTNISHN